MTTYAGFYGTDTAFTSSVEFAANTPLIVYDDDGTTLSPTYADHLRSGGSLGSVVTTSSTGEFEFYAEPGVHVLKVGVAVVATVFVPLWDDEPIAAGSLTEAMLAFGVATQSELDAHVLDALDAHDAAAVSVSPFGSITSTDVQAALAEVVAKLIGEPIVVVGLDLDVIAGDVLSTVAMPSAMQLRAIMSGGAACDGVNDQIEINAAFEAARDAGRSVTLIGNFTVDFVANPHGGVRWSALWLQSDVLVSATRARFTLVDNAAYRDQGDRVSLVAPADTDATSQFAQNGVWVGGTFNGNAANQITTGGLDNAGVEFDGFELVRAFHWTVRGVTVRNTRGTSGGGGPHETFHFDSNGGGYNTFENCLADNDIDATGAYLAATGTGFSANGSEGTTWSNCISRFNSFQGFTMYRSHGSTRINCRGWGNGAAGFRVEEGDDNEDIGCQSGGYDRRSGSAEANLVRPLPNLGNGLNLKGGTGSTQHNLGYRAIGCDFSNNAGHGVQLNGSLDAVFDGCLVRDNGAIFVSDLAAFDRVAATASKRAFVNTDNLIPSNPSRISISPSCVIKGNGGATALGTGNQIELKSTVEATNASKTMANGFKGNSLASPLGPTDPATGAFPLTGVTISNPYPTHERVWLASGIVTGVTINGVTMPFVPPILDLAPFDTIALTYSSAPTWVWQSQFVRT